MRKSSLHIRKGQDIFCADWGATIPDGTTSSFYKKDGPERMANHVSFYLNGKEVSIQDPSPDLLLIDYLRSPEVALAGPKKPCGQGGCGGCTVILSNWNPAEKEIEHRA